MVIALAKAKPGAFSYGSSGNGGLTHLITEMFAAQADIKLVHVPYKSTGAALPDFLSGTIQVYVGNVSPLLPNIQSGKLKLIAVTNAERWPLLPNVPTIGETLPGFAADPWFGVFAPRGTPQPIIERLNTAINKLKDEEDVKRNFIGQGMLPRGVPAQFNDTRATARWSRWSPTSVSRRTDGVRVDARRLRSSSPRSTGCGMRTLMPRDRRYPGQADLWGLSRTACCALAGTSRA